MLPNNPQIRQTTPELPPKKKKKKIETCGFVVGCAEDEAAMEKGRVGGGKSVQASPHLELGL